jgi:hypothetical protein
MNRIPGIIKMHYKNKISWLLLPWMIMGGSFIVNLFISILLGGDTTIYTGGIASLYISLFIVGLVSLKETFALALGFSMRRTDYFLGTITTILATSVVAAVLLFLLSFVESGLTGGWWVNLYFFHLPYLNDGSPIQQLWIYFSLVVHMYLCGFVIASIHQRFGRPGSYTFFIVLLLLLSAIAAACSYFGRWGDLLGWFVQHSMVEVASWMVLIAVGYALALYLLLRRATVS